MLRPHCCSSSRGKRSVLNGIAYSTIQPPATVDVFTLHTPSQFWLVVRPSSNDCVSRQAPPGLVWKP